MPLTYGARVWLRAASFADQKEKNDSNASEHLENGRLACNNMSVNVILLSNIYKAARITILSIILCKAF